jgi:hypothetical protein
MLGVSLTAAPLYGALGGRLTGRDETPWSGVRMYASRPNKYALPASWTT